VLRCRASHCAALHAAGAACERDNHNDNHVDDDFGDSSDVSGCFQHQRRFSRNAAGKQHPGMANYDDVTNYHYIESINVASTLCVNK